MLVVMGHFSSFFYSKNSLVLLTPKQNPWKVQNIPEESINVVNVDDVLQMIKIISSGRHFINNSVVSTSSLAFRKVPV